MERYNVHQMGIEITRRCNMRCDHCIRGDAQALDLDLGHVRKLFDRVSYIGSLCLTGGEPSLVPHIISEIVDIAKEKGVTIGSMDITTNAKEVSDEFLMALLKLWCYCDDIDEASFVGVSNDTYHDYEWEEGYKKLSALKFVSKRQQKDGAHYEPIVAGRAAQYWGSGRTERLSEFMVEEWGEEKGITETILYMNAKGMLFGSCDLSYEQQEIPTLQVCSVESDEDLAEACERYNERIEPFHGEVSEIEEAYEELEEAA